MAGLDQHVVSTFMSDNPSFVRRWFQSNVDIVTLQEWLNEDEEDDELCDLPGKSSYSIGPARNSLTSKMFQDFLKGKNKKEVKIRTKTDLSNMNDMDIFMELIRDVANELDVDILCHKILTNVSILTKSDRGSLFLVRGSKTNKYLVSKLFDVTEDSLLEDVLHNEENHIKVPFGRGIAGTVADTKQLISIKDAYEDDRFNKAVDKLTGYRTKSLLCMPILNYEGEVIGVAQIMNKTDPECDVFTERDEEVFKNYLTFCGIGLTNAQLFEMSVEEYKRNQLLLNLAKGIFAEQQNLDKLVEKIMLEAQDLLQCQRCSVFLIDDTMQGDSFFKEMHSELMEKCHKKSIKNLKEGNEVFTKHTEAVAEVGKPAPAKKVQFAKAEDVSFIKVFQLKVGKDGAKGTVKNINMEELEVAGTTNVAKQVAHSLEPFNIADMEASDETEMEDYDGLKVKGLLAIPITNEKKFCIGVVSLINKLNNKPFTDTDINVLEAFSIFCGLGIHNCQMYEGACKLMAKQTVALEVLSYHASASTEETEELMKLDEPDAEKIHLYQYDFNDMPMDDMQTCAAAVKMFVDVGIVKTFRVPQEVMCRWILSVKRNYRPVTYHNWRHALNVAQTMCTMCVTSGMDRIFVKLEIFSLLVACLSHDLDHRGTNNTFQSKVESPIAQLYSTSTMEHHHFDQCVMILNSDGNNIFMNLSPRLYKEAIKTVESAILSTDLALYFKKKGSFSKMIDSGEKDWIETDKRDTLRGMMMTACDVAAITKPWEIQKEVAHLVAAEFFEQGDLEREVLNEDPIAMMDRKKKQELPKMQVGFIDFICTPVYKMLAEVEPKMQPLLDGVLNNRREWQALSDSREAEAKAEAAAAAEEGNNNETAAAAPTPKPVEPPKQTPVVSEPVKEPEPPKAAAPVEEPAKPTSNGVHTAPPQSAPPQTNTPSTSQETPKKKKIQLPDKVQNLTKVCTLL